MLLVRSGGMRNLLKPLFTLLLFAGFGLSIYFKGRMPNAVVEPIAERAPAAETFTESKTALANEYRFYREIHAKMENQKPILDLSLEGKVWLTETTRSSESTHYLVQFEMKAKEQKESIVSQVPSLIEVSKKGELLSFQARPATTKEEEDQVQLMKDFATLFAYRTSEDTTGKYEYEWKPDVHGGNKVKTKYLGAQLSKTKILNSQHRVDLDPIAKTVQKIKGLDELLLAGDAGTSIRTKSIYSISSLGLVKHKTFAYDSRVLIGESLQLVSHFQAREVVAATRLLEASSHLEGMKKDERISLFHEWVKTLRRDSNDLKSFAAYFEAEAASRPGLLTFAIGVLATFGTDGAQAQLRDWYQKYASVDKNETLGHSILNALATSGANLSQETKQFLMQVAQDSAHPDLAENAVLTLGASIKTNDDSAVRDRLTFVYAASTGASRLNAIEAMGNSGQSQFVPTLVGAYQSGTSAERAAATFAFRFVNPTIAAPYLMKAYQDADPMVKRAAVRAIGYQSDLSPYLSFLRSCASEGNGDCSRLVSMNP